LRALLPLIFLAGYLVARVVLGAMLNPPLNGPDEGGHVEYVRTLIESGGRHVSGVEARQPATYYLLAAVPWQAAADTAPNTQLFWTRLLGCIGGLMTLAAAWAAARVVWPGAPGHSLAVAAVAALAPGYLYLLASVNNDPLAVGLASVAVLAGLRLWRGETPWRWIVVWIAASLAAVATKLTAAPVGLAAAMALLWRFRAVLLKPLWARTVVAAVVLAGVAGYLFLLSKHPTTSAAASMAHFGPLALLRAPVTYWRLGGLAESFRTFWYAYDYEVRVPRLLETVLGGSAALVGVAAIVGLVASRPRLPGLLWAAAVAQVVLVVGRFSLADVLQVDFGGAAQAKAFFPALVPLAILLVAGLSTVVRWVWPRYLARDRWLGLGIFAWLLALDAISLALTTWHHYRWWQATL